MNNPVLELEKRVKCLEHYVRALLARVAELEGEVRLVGEVGGTTDYHWEDLSEEETVVRADEQALRPLRGAFPGYRPR